MQINLSTNTWLWDSVFWYSNLLCKSINYWPELSVCLKLDSCFFFFLQYVTLDEAKVLCDKDETIFPFHLPIEYLWLTCDELWHMASLCWNVEKQTWPKASPCAANGGCESRLQVLHYFMLCLYSLYMHTCGLQLVRTLYWDLSLYVYI
jgi:hypothetical protein